ncbi:MAG: tetratricopeptide repeat protein [Thermodesulfobacteriota bacterium]|nr:tetratricopeptide repeat protein [Thermodesulfobacteriota bacterium]
MSVIFETLQKLKRDAGEGEGGASKQEKRGNVYSFQGILFSFPGIVVSAAIVLGAGLGLSYGVEYFSSGLQTNPVASTVSEKDKLSGGVAFLPDKEVRSQAIPPPPERIPVEEAEPGRLYLPSATKINTGQSEPDAELRYIPPEAARERGVLSHSTKRLSSTAPDVSDNGGPSRDEGYSKRRPSYFTEGSREGQLPVRPPDLPNKRSSIRGTLSPQDEEHTSPSVFDSYDYDHTQDRARGFSRPKQASVLSATLITRDSGGPRQADSTSSGALDTTGKLISGEDERRKKIHLARVKKSAHIARLVADIHRAIHMKDSLRVEALFNELIKIKGKEDDYVTRLKAFWRLKQRDYESASLLLESLLQKNGDDLEAGINMAIVEIKTNRLDQARTRLQRLRYANGDNTHIASLLKKIGR